MAKWTLKAQPTTHQYPTTNKPLPHNHPQLLNNYSLPTIATISSIISNKNTDFFYELAHGNQNYFQANTQGAYYYASTLHQDMLQRQPMRFAFIGSCQGMIGTGSGTFSYEFRKGQMTDTVTIGFDHMETCPGWAYEWYWQDSLFENMSKGLTIKQSFDDATAQYPTIQPAVVFLGDENLKIPLPNLEADGNLNWPNEKPGDQITNSFTVKNIGDNGSALDWKIESYPSWGTWNFNPFSGENLTPEQNIVTINLVVVVPNEENADFSGEIKIINQNNHNDYNNIQVSLTTPKLKPNLSYFKDHYPILFKLLSSYYN
jgi:hypothetical protein